jgi:O-antigen/teichoic acid export membrane protein
LAWFFGTLVGLLVALAIFLKKYKNTLTQGKISINKKLSKQIFSYSIWVILASQ